ncbi:DUF935 domain-containing protein [Rhodospirillum sp. A1_3_36]|uniref:DUF935 domain-containing protein n=1 Tax=Rhodospirillum sp. A1_3_36 TaxID=3391666 RepID=UPI0039A5AEBA
MAKRRRKSRPGAPKPPSVPIFETVASVDAGSAREMASLLTGWQVPADDVLKSLHWDLGKYRETLRDEQVKTCFQQRIDAVIAAEWRVEPGADDMESKKAADHLREQLEALRFDEDTRQALHANWYGFAVGEAMWGRDAGKVILEDILFRKAERFRWHRDGTFRKLAAGHPEGLVMPERKLWVPRIADDSDDHPHAPGLARWCWWPAWLKKHGLKFWSIALEKFGAPTVAGTYPKGATPAEIAKTLEAAMALAFDTAVALPEGAALELVEAKRQSGGDHQVFCAYMDTMIAKVILGSAGTTENGPWRGTAEVHAGVKEDLVKADADLVCESFNDTIATWLTEWNWPGATPPQVWRETAPGEDLDRRAERDQRLSQATGRDLDADYVEETYGVRLAPPKAQASQPAPAFAEAPPIVDDVDTLVDQVEAATAPTMDAMIDRVRTILFQEAASLEDAIARVERLYPDLGLDALAGVLGQGLTLADLQGRADGDSNG